MISIRHQGLRTRARRLAAAATALNQASGDTRAPFSIVLMTDANHTRNGAPTIRALPAGAAVIFRGYNDPQRRRRARTIGALCAARGVVFLIAGDARLAEQVAADGVHLPGWMLDHGGPRPPGRLVTAACHSASDLVKAAAIGADAALLSPVFKTASHPDARALGAETFKALAADAQLPVLALGGVDETNALKLAGKNVAGFAAISAFDGLYSPAS